MGTCLVSQFALWNIEEFCMMILFARNMQFKHTLTHSHPHTAFFLRTCTTAESQAAGDWMQQQPLQTGKCCMAINHPPALLATICLLQKIDEGL